MEDFRSAAQCPPEYSQEACERMKSRIKYPDDIMPRKCTNEMTISECNEYKCPETHRYNDGRSMCEKMYAGQDQVESVREAAAIAATIIAPSALVSYRVYKNHGIIPAAVAAPVSALGSLIGFGFGIMLFPPLMAAPLAAALLYYHFAKKD